MGFLDAIRNKIKQLIRAPDSGVLIAENDLETQKKKENNLLITNKKTKTMSMFNYGVGGNEVKVDANEAIQEIQENKTLLVSKLTNEETINPEIVTGLKTVEDVFRHFKPTISVEHETKDGQSLNEEFRFGNLGDFTPKNITQQSKYMNELSLQEEQYNKIIRQLKTNKVLRNLVENAETKEAFVNSLKAIINELETNPAIQ